MNKNFDKTKKIIILHDYFLYKGGGERLVISMAKHLGADIATAFIAKDAFDPRTEIKGKVFELFSENIFSKIPGFRFVQVQLSFLFKTKFLKKYDIVIHSGDTLFAWLRSKKQTHIAYMHTPPRHLFDCYKERLAEYGLIKKVIFIPFAWINRPRFRYLSSKMDKILTNSVNTQKRIKKYLHLESTVVYPPCDTLPFKDLGSDGYFFSWARLYEIKRVHMIVKAFQKMSDKKLVVASGGPELERIQKMATDYPNIKVLGWISDEELIDYLGKSLATIYIPIREDFGMSPVESMTAGKPVIGSKEGGLLEIIEDGKNGLFLPNNFNVEDIRTAVKKMTQQKVMEMKEYCFKTAGKFTDEKFKENLEKEL